MRNKHLSVLMLYVRGVVYPVIAALVLLVAVQTGLFFWALQRGADSLDMLIHSMFCRFVWIGAVLLMIALLSRMYGGGYTVRRLRISEHTVFLWHSLSNLLCFLLLWLAEVTIITLLCRYFLTLPVAGTLSPQALFLAFYSNDFLHSLFPLEEISRWVFLLVSFIVLALSSANAIVRLRYGEKPFPLLLAALAFVWCFKRALGSFDVLLILYYLCLGFYAIWDVWNHVEEATADEAG